VNIAARIALRQIGTKTAASLLPGPGWLYLDHKLAILAAVLDGKHPRWRSSGPACRRVSQSPCCRNGFPLMPCGDLQIIVNAKHTGNNISPHPSES
jgi:hypothetical protein